MKLKPVKRIPALIAFGVIAAVCILDWLRLDFIERVERITFDQRARQALSSSPVVATNLGFVFIDEQSIAFVRTNRVLGYRFGLYWPRQVYGHLANELAAQGARAVAFDVIFGELRPDHAPVQMADGSLPESDEFFASQLQRAGNVILAVTKDLKLPALFRTNAMALGDISTDKDSDGVLRRAQAFTTFRQWHPLFEKAEIEYGFDLARARIEPGQILLTRADGEQVKVPLDKEGKFEVAAFVGNPIPVGLPPKAKAFTEERIWNMGIVLAAQQLKLDLDRAEVDLPHGRITLRGADGLERILPVDTGGNFYIDWCLPPNHPHLTEEPIQELLVQNSRRLQGHTNDLTSRWAAKLVVVGSSALGNDLTDRGATPLGKDTLLVSKHWNVANSILTGRFVHRAPLWEELASIIALGIISALLTLELRVLLASGLVLLTGVAYAAFAVVLYGQTRYWIPLVLPLGGALLMNYAFLLAWRVLFEQAEVRRVKVVFSTVVDPKIMKELLHAESLSLDGARREVTVLFADIRGFTALTDSAREQAAAYVRQHNLRGADAEACFAEQARQTLETVNLYLGLIADIIKKQDGTLDKYIGDCVMAFWGAPTPNLKHAATCVRAAIEAQRAVDQLNQQRAAENQRRELENKARLSAGLKTKSILPLLQLGSGINTGVATAGLMGSQAEQKNYTVFGGDVNLASRLEGLSGHGRIFISESTFEHLRRDDPALAATCVAQPPQKVKGIADPVNVFEVPWRPIAERTVEKPSATEFLPAPAHS